MDPSFHGNNSCISAAIKGWWVIQILLWVRLHQSRQRYGQLGPTGSHAHSCWITKVFFRFKNSTYPTRVPGLSFVGLLDDSVLCGFQSISLFQRNFSSLSTLCSPSYPTSINNHCPSYPANINKGFPIAVANTQTRVRRGHQGPWGWHQEGGGFSQPLSSVLRFVLNGTEIYSFIISFVYYLNDIK